MRLDLFFSSVLEVCATLLANGESDLINDNSSFKVIGNCKIHPSASIHPCAKIGPNAVISEGCVVKRGACIKNSILMANVTVDESAYVANSIVGEGSGIGRWARIEGHAGSSDSIASEGVCGSRKVQPISVLSGKNSVCAEVILRNCIVLPNKELKSNFFNEVIM